MCSASFLPSNWLKIPLLGTLEVYGHCEARGELPEPSDVRDALDLPGSGFTMTGSAMDRSRLGAFSYGWKVLHVHDWPAYQHVCFSPCSPPFHTTRLPAGSALSITFSASHVAFLSVHRVSMPMPCMVWFHVMCWICETHWNDQNINPTWLFKTYINLNLISTDQIWLCHDCIAFGTCADLNVGRCVVVRGLLAQLALSLKHFSFKLAQLGRRNIWVSCS